MLPPPPPDRAGAGRVPASDVEAGVLVAVGAARVAAGVLVGLATGALRAPALEVRIAAATFAVACPSCRSASATTPPACA